MLMFLVLHWACSCTVKAKHQLPLKLSHHSLAKTKFLFGTCGGSLLRTRYTTIKPTVLTQKSRHLPGLSATCFNP